MENRPNIYNYLDFRAYLRDIYRHLKLVERGFSYRKFAMRAGYNAPNNLKRVMEGSRNLTGDSIERFSRGLRLTRAESDYFEALVNWNQAEDGPTRKHYEAIVRRRAAIFQTENLAAAAYDYLAGILNAVVREAINRDGLPQRATDIKDSLYFPVKKAEVERALVLLKKLKLVQVKDGRLVQTQNVVQTEDDLANLAARSYHAAALAWAAQMFDYVPREERLLGGVTASISEKRLQELREFLTVQRHQLATFLAEDDGEPIARVVQINYQMFPVTKSI